MWDEITSLVQGFELPHLHHQRRPIARSTPTIDGGKVYVYGANLDLYCFDAKSGKQLWAKDIPGDYGGKNISWQNATSPLIDGNLVIVSGGGAGAPRRMTLMPAPLLFWLPEHLAAAGGA